VPRLTKGGKWVFGWTVIGANGEIPIPPEAFREYGYDFGDIVFFLKGSKTSGGFSIGRSERLAQSKIELRLRLLGQGVIDPSRQIVQPTDLSLKPGDRLLVVRGSGLALGFLQHGPIYYQAILHPEIETFSIDSI
jgi:hypothetical protein